MKVIVTTPSFGKFHDDIKATLNKKGIELTYLIPYSRNRMIKEIGNADVLIVGLEQIDREIINCSNSLKLIAKHGVGTDNIDLKAAGEKGIIVANTPGTNNDAVADLAFGLMLSAARSIVAANNKVKDGEWPRFDGHSVWGKTLGIIGLGAIGKGVARRANGFSMEVLGYDITDKSPDEEALNINRVSFHELLSRSDYISLHVPLNKHTKGMIGKEQLKRMKETSILINTARGGLIDEEELYKALTNSSIQSCALDVFETEPVKDKKLLSLDSLTVTPHMAAYTVEAGYLTSQMIISNLYNLLEGNELKNIVNKSNNVSV
ncbi:phosphoglycerate dehydrogenase [Oceanobacillus sojae]|uniref:4-phosphoerythronate dehydrogenase n=1 Tax=Oceanobacillus sojae TaxID=582851 RepID=A0A511ZFH0_9BACI|nr:phosphoglycerate dehydrogenase [Oceanobacillus sojae]GEN86141.1 4-phosphoerythronate dehydrogenase [Oceanobacillus sojae]